MTYCDWREELILTEGAKTRFIIKGLKKLKGIIKKPKRNIFPIGSTKASGRLNVDPDLIAQFPGVNIRKLAYPDYKAPRNPKLAKAIKIAKDKLDRGKNPKFKGASPYSTDVPPAIPNVRAPIPPKLSQEIKANLSKGTKLTDNQKKNNFADYVKSLVKKIKDKNKIKKNLKTYEGDNKYYPPEIGESAIAMKAGSKLIPALMTGIGATGTIMQIKKKIKKVPSDAAAKRLENIRNNKLYKQSKNPKDPNYLEKVLRNLRKEEVAIANSMSGGGIGGSVEAGDEPPVKKKKPPILARGKMPGARNRFKSGVELLAKLKENK